MTERVDTPRDRHQVTHPELGGSARYAAVGRLLQAITRDEPGIGEVIPGFRIDRTIGAGGGGRVYRAFHEGSDQALALKVLTAPLGNGRASARVFREIDVLESLRLPAVAGLLHHGTHDGRTWLATEFIDGPTLAEVGPDMRADIRRGVALLARVADAVQAVHERGIIHRDLKPGNVVVTAGDHPVLVDFGIAALIDNHAQTLTADGAALGTPAYMAPEQARGDRAAISTRTDVYGLGAVACWVLTGHTPFDTNCSLHEALRRVGHEPPREPCTLRRDLPRPLAAVIAKATATDPARRYASAGELAADLRRWLRDEPVTAVAPGLWQRALRWVGRHPVLTTAGACGVVALAMLTGALVLIALGWSRPAAVILTGNSRGLCVVSWLGRPIRSWDTGTDNGISSYAVVTRRDGRRVLVFAVGSTERVTTDLACDVYAVDFDHPNRILWTSADPHRRPVMPDKGPGTTRSDTYQARQVRAIRIFENLPDEQLLAVHSNTWYSGSCVRVYSLDGDVLSEVWHDGQISDAAWIPADDARDHPAPGGMIVAFGVNSERCYGQLGVDGAMIAANPPVVFGFHPPDGRHGWIRTPTEPDPVGDVDVRPEWYYFLCPGRYASWLEPREGRLEQSSGMTGTLRLSIPHMTTPPDPKGMGTLFWSVARTGPLLNATPGNTYLARPDMPPLSDWTWESRPD